MHPRRLDRHLKKEAKLLVRDAKRLRDGTDHGAVIGRVERALAQKDRVALRQAMPPLDELVEELARTKKLKLHHQLFDGVMWLVSLAALVFVLRTFVVQVFQIPSSSMYPTLMIGDHLFVNKFIYGLDIPFSDGKLFTRSPERGEIIVFAQPCTPERDYIKRVVALAGDTVEVRCNRLHINGKPVEETRVDDGNCEYEDFGFVNELGEPCDRRDPTCQERWHPKKCSRYRESLGGYTYETFYSEQRPKSDAIGTRGGHDFPALDDRTVQHCGTDTGVLAPNQAPGKIVDVKAGGACELQVHYVVPEGHVFAMGDNRDSSNDSRFWGSVPLENIRGKAMFIWLSYRDFPFQLRLPRMGDFVH